MIDKLIIDGTNIELTEKDKIPYTYAFSTAKTHIVKYALSDTNEISAGAFANCTYMTKVKFPPEIKMIKRRAFENCIRLNNVVIPETIEYIGANVWNGCTGMTEIHFEGKVPPSNASDIPNGCVVYVPNDTKYVKVEGELDPDNEIYYEKSDWNVYTEVSKRLLVQGKEYYKDNWTTIAPNNITVEEKNRIPITDIEFEQSSMTTSVADDKNVILTINYTILPENATNRALHFYSSNPNSSIKILDTEKEGELVIECEAKKYAQTKFTIYAESGVSSSITITAQT